MEKDAADENADCPEKEAAGRWSRKAREALNGRPVKERSRAEYQKVVNAYRRIYFEAPTAGRASYAVVAEAEVMVEMGRQFNDEKMSSCGRNIPAASSVSTRFSPWVKSIKMT